MDIYDINKKKYLTSIHPTYLSWKKTGRIYIF